MHEQYLQTCCLSHQLCACQSNTLLVPSQLMPPLYGQRPMLRQPGQLYTVLAQKGHVIRSQTHIRLQSMCFGRQTVAQHACYLCNGITKKAVCQCTFPSDGASWYHPRHADCAGEMSMIGLQYWPNASTCKARLLTLPNLSHLPFTLTFACAAAAQRQRSRDGVHY